MTLFVFVCDIDVEDQFLCIIVQRFYHVLEFNAVDPLSVDESRDLCDDLTGLFKPNFFASDVSKIRLLCTHMGCRNDT